jgi:hypothetical protein
MKKLIIIVTIFITILSIIEISCKPTDDQNVREPIKVNAEDLRWAYHRNEAEADAKYRGKILEVTGVIYLMNKSGILLTDGSENMMVGVSCSFDESAESQVALLDKQQTLTIWGRCEGRLYENVLLKNCSLSNPLPATSDLAP